MYDYFMKKLIWQMFILGCDNLDTALENGLGGVIFFKKDIQTQEQFKTLVSEIGARASIRPFLSIDQEGGRVERTENIRPKRLSAKYAFAKGEEFLKKQSEEISEELSEYGINLNFAPCADVDSNPKNPIIGERSFSNNPDDVIKGINIFTEASRKYGVIPCVKHFPGHGDADQDSHLVLPVINLPFTEMEKIHIKPFQKAIETGIEMIMVAHLHCTCFDKESIPTSLSKNTIRYLRQDLNFQGVIISDDMVMKGIAGYDSIDACIKGIEAGLDMFIFRNSDAETLRTISELCQIIEKNPDLQKKVEESYGRILKLKQKYKII